LTDNAVDVVQPCVSHAGGISEVVKIANLADTFEVAIAPTSPNGPISYAASLQVDAYASNFLIQNNYSPFGSAPGDADQTYVENISALLPTNDRIDVPEKPGLGIDIDEEFLEKQAAKDVEWDVPTWRHHDASIAEW
jgi:galactonate dehydratase